jgi:hypothetical protein
MNVSSPDILALADASRSLEKFVPGIAIMVTRARLFC